MATLQATTSSTWSEVDPDAADQIESIIDEYNFWGVHTEVNVEIKDNRDDETIISIYGHAAFDPAKPIYEDGEVVDEQHGCAEEFLKRIAPYLEEQLVIETIGHEKARFPLLAGQWAVWPDGTIRYDSFDHSPEKPETNNRDNRSDDAAKRGGVAQ